MRHPKLSKDDKGNLARNLKEAGCASERAMIVDEYAVANGVEPRTVYRWAKEGGYQPERKCRSDTGIRKLQIPLEAIERAAVAKARSKTKKYHDPMPAKVAIDITGGAAYGVKPHHVYVLRKQKGLDRNSIKKATPHIIRRGTRPNGEHQFDTSRCRIWYLDNRQKVYRSAVIGRERIKESRVKPLVRYVVCDHMTHTIFFQYQQQAESFKSSGMFLHEAWSEKPDPDKFPFCGTPQKLYVDQGPTYKSEHFKRLCENLEIELIGGQPAGTRSKSGKVGHPRARGSIEVAHNIIEVHFESRFSAQTPSDLWELNMWAYKWAAWFNGTAIHSRYKATRSALWESIRNEELRIPPTDQAVFMELGSKWARCKINRDMTIRFKGKRYWLEGVPVDLCETYAEVMFSPYSLPEIRIKGVNGHLYHASPMAEPDLSQGGYYDYTVEPGSFRSYRDTSTEHGEKWAEQYNLGEMQAFPDFPERLKNLRYMPKSGQEIKPNRPPQQLSMYEALGVIRDALGRAISIEENKALRAKYGDWMQMDDVAFEIEQMKTANWKRQIREGTGDIA